MSSGRFHRDILSEIFHYHLQVPPYPGRSPLRVRSEHLALSTIEGDERNLYSPVVLGLVCRDWRDASMSTPSLWSVVVVQNPTDDHLRHFQLWLSRSGACPLNLTFLGLPEHGNSTTPTINIFELAVSASNRWKRLEISTDFWPRIHIPAINDCLDAANTTLLTHFEFSMLRYPANCPLRLFTSKSPRLKDVSIDGNLYEDLEPSTRQAITTLVLRKVCPDPLFIPLFSTSYQTAWPPYLINLTIELEDSESFVLPETLDFPMLRTFAVVDVKGSSHLHSLLDVLRLPSLVDLSVIVGTRHGLTPLIWNQSVPDFIARSSCTLTSLSITSIQAPWKTETEGGIVTLLSLPALQPLRKLYVSGFEGWQTIGSLTVTKGTTHKAILPNLTCLAILNCDPGPAYVPGMLRSRTCGFPDVARLQSLEVEYTSPRCLKKDRRFLKDFDYRGLQVRLAVWEKDWST